MSDQFNGFILFRDYKAYFKRGIIGSVEIGRIKIYKEDLMNFLKHVDASTKVKYTKSGLQIFDESLYKRLLVYAVAFSFIRKKSSLRILRLIEAVKKLDDYSLHFWYTEALTRYKDRRQRGLGRVSRSIRVLYGVDR
jgi:hypothetical protein